MGVGLVCRGLSVPVRAWCQPSLKLLSSSTDLHGCTSPTSLLYPGPTGSPSDKTGDRITLSMQAKQPGQAMISGPVDLSVDQVDSLGYGQDSYQRLLGDALRGDESLFAREDGVMEAWRIVQPVLDQPDPVSLYERGSWGPEPSDILPGSDWEWITSGSD